MKDLELPYNQKAVVVVRRKSNVLPGLFGNQPDTVQYEGIIQGSAEFDPRESFRMVPTDDPSHLVPVRVILRSDVVKINGTKVAFTKIKEEAKPEPTTMRIPSSKKGKFYNVVINVDGTARCECPGFGYRQTCSHIDKAREMLAEKKK